VADPLVIETTDLRKTFGTVHALRGLTLAVPAGSICGFLGRNGAGKTTTIKVLLGMAQPTGGEARVFGLAADNPQDSVAIRRRTGFVSEDKELYDYMSVGEIVRFTASFYPRWDRDLEQRYLKAFDLPIDRGIKSLSLGMRTKLAVLLALCRGADLLILDEPTSGLDPSVIDEVLQALVAHVANRGATVFFSTSSRSPIASSSSSAGRRSSPAPSTICATATAASRWCSRPAPRRLRSTPPASSASTAKAVSSPY
jgi:ABC-2 type transport system ATP-binding protein